MTMLRAILLVTSMLHNWRAHLQKTGWLWPCHTMPALGCADTVWATCHASALHATGIKICLCLHSAMLTMQCVIFVLGTR